MNKIYLAAVLLLSFIVAGQTATGIQGSEIFANPEIKAEYPGGLKEFYSFVGKNFVAPQVEKDTEFKFYFSYVVEIDGSLSDIAIIRDPGLGMGDEALRVIKLSGLWKPATTNGVAVRSKATLPLIITAKAGTPLQAQPVSGTGGDINQETVYTQPSYPGGTDKFQEDLFRNFQMPESSAAINAVVYMRFTVETDGSVTEVLCIRDPGYGLGMESIKAVNQLKRKWIPATRNGVPIRYTVSLPLSISIEAGAGPKTAKSRKINREVGPPVNRGGEAKVERKPFRQR